MSALRKAACNFCGLVGDHLSNCPLWPPAQRHRWTRGGMEPSERGVWVRSAEVDRLRLIIAEMADAATALRLMARAALDGGETAGSTTKTFRE